MNRPGVRRLVTPHASWAARTGTPCLSIVSTPRYSPGTTRDRGHGQSSAAWHVIPIAVNVVVTVQRSDHAERQQRSNASRQRLNRDVMPCHGHVTISFLHEGCSHDTSKTQNTETSKTLNFVHYNLTLTLRYRRITFPTWGLPKPA